MGNELRFDGKVVIITGAGNGLGRSHALLFGSRGAKVVVNDLGGSATGGGKSSAAADAVVAAIKAAGGEAVANYDSVEDGAKIVQQALDTFGRLDVVVNNAGILRDVSFPKMTQEDWDLIYRVHVLGAFRVTHAAWPHLRDQGYGRVLFTASAAGIYGNFGQANYAMAKLGLVGFAQTLALEGKKKNVLVNAIAPIAGSRMTETVLPANLLEALKPEYVSPLVAWLSHEKCEETGSLFEVGGGFFGKLRWERAEGETVRVGRAITPELVRDRFAAITGFERTTHPASVTESMAPIMANLERGPTKGANEFIDVDQALGFQFPEARSAYTEKDLSLYALGVGAANDPLDPKDLSVVYEMAGDGFRALPTYAVIPALNAMLDAAKEGKGAPGLKYGFDRVLHGEQSLELTRPLPPHAKLTHRARVKSIFDKGKHALVVVETKTFDDTGDLLCVNETTTFVRGAGGFGGDRGPSTDVNVAPDRAPDATTTEAIPKNQALLYRLSGDWNPLHADPGFAKNFGFEKPILHGLCTYGYAARHVINAFSKGDPRFFKSIRARFADTVFPGQTLVTEMWRDGDHRVVFRCKVKETGKVVLSNAAIELFAEIPQKKAAPPAEAKAAAASAEPNSADIFAGIRAYVEKNPDLAGKVNTTYLFALKDPESKWTLDLKGKGSVAPGAPEKPECTLELTDADFMAMCTGKADAMKLFTTGKLKIAGNIMASQKLEFLRKLDPEMVLAATRARTGSSAASAPAATPPTGVPPVDAPTSAEIFAAIRDHVENDKELAAKVATVFQFKLKDPESTWTLDLKKGVVAAGETEKPECTLELADADFLAMTGGKADPMKLFTTGKLKIGGNIMASQKLDFLKKMDPERAKAAIAKARAAGGTAAAAAPTTGGSKAPKAPGIFAALAERLAKNPALAGDVQAVIQWVVTDQNASWTTDLRAAPGTVRDGATNGADATIRLTDETLAELASGAQTAQSLYQHGQLKVDGDVRVAHRLGFMKSLGLGWF